MKYDNDAGAFRLDSDFAKHREECTACQGFNADQPASARLLCLEGATLWKRENIVHDRVRQKRPELWANWKTVKRLMRYK